MIVTEATIGKFDTEIHAINVCKYKIQQCTRWNRIIKLIETKKAGEGGGSYGSRKYLSIMVRLLGDFNNTAFPCKLIPRPGFDTGILLWCYLILYQSYNMYKISEVYCIKKGYAPLHHLNK